MRNPFFTATSEVGLSNYLYREIIDKTNFTENVSRRLFLLLTMLMPKEFYNDNLAPLDTFRNMEDLPSTHKWESH